jgi:two-component system NtrC family sensor kinase
LAAGVAHEINNPLTAINANAEILKLTIAPEDDNFESVDLIQQAGERATAVVRGLLDFARQEQYAFTAGDVNKSIRQALALAHYQLQTAATQVMQNLADDLPPVVASWEHLKSVWLNVIINARDALQETAGERQLEITTRLGSEQSHVQVLFRDNGKGMTAAELAHIFEPFYTTKDPGKGTGLGLATSHRIIEQHGGEINVDSTPGEGTTFIIRLPLNNEEGRN